MPVWMVQAKTRPRWLALAAIALTAMLLMIASMPAALGADPAVDKGWIDGAIRFRESVGLESGRPFVRSTFGNDAYSSDDFSVPLSQEEVDIIRDRQRRTALATPGHAWANSQKDFAGAWTDQRRDGVIVYQFTGDIADEKVELRRLLPAEVIYEVRSVERSLADLRELKAEIRESIEALQEDGVDITGIGLDTRDNVVSVDVSRDVPRARTILEERFGDAIDVEQGGVAVADTAGASTPRVKLPKLPLAFGSGSGVGWDHGGGDAGVGWRDRGAWSVTDARTGPDGQLRFHVSVTPPVREAPLDEGPAILSAALWYQGGLGGDVGFERVEQLRNLDAGTCTGSPCTYEIDVVLDAATIPRAIASLPHVDPAGVDIGLSLVRTYGQGEWLQVLDLLIPELGSSWPDRHGTLRRPTEANGRIVSGGIFRAADAQATRSGRKPSFNLVSVVEASRARQGDASAVTPTVGVALQVDAPGCRWWSPVWIIDEWGTTGFAGAVGAMDPRGEVIRLPGGGKWRVAMGNPFPESRHTRSVTAGTFETAASDLRVRVTFECESRDSAVAPGFIVETVDQVPEASTVGAWSRVRDAYSGRNRSPRPFVVAAIDGALLSLESGPKGWRLRRSDDGWRWQAQPFMSRGRELPESGSADHARLVSTDAGLVLAMVVERASGAPRLMAWTSKDGRRWRSASAMLRLPDPVTDLQVAATTDVVLALATSPGRARLLSSDDGRAWRATGPTAVAIGSGIDRILGIIDDGGRMMVSTTMDGQEWMPLWSLPAGSIGPYRVAETASGVLLVATGDEDGAVVWLHESEGSAWLEVMRTGLTTRIDDLDANGNDVVMSGAVSDAGTRTSGAAWFAASHDGGRRWRQSLDSETSGRCRMRTAAGDGALVVATADCDDQPTVWRTDHGGRE